MDDGDLYAIDELLHHDVIVEFPQSGERIRGRANRRAKMENYPGGGIRPVLGRVIGGEDQWIATPAYTVVRVSGQGDEFVTVGKIRYPPSTRMSLAWPGWWCHEAPLLARRISQGGQQGCGARIVP